MLGRLIANLFTKRNEGIRKIILFNSTITVLVFIALVVVLKVAGNVLTWDNVVYITVAFGISAFANSKWS